MVYYSQIRGSFVRGYADARRTRGLPELNDWCRNEGMTIFEYMFIDNISYDDLEAIAAKSLKMDDWQIRYIAQKSSMLIQRLQPDHSVGEIRRIIDIELRYHRYANARCREILRIKPWELMKHKALIDYKREWKAALERCFWNSKLR